MFRIEKTFLLLEYTNYMFSGSSAFSLNTSLDYYPSEKHKLTYTLWIPLISRVNRTLNLEYGEQTEEKKWASFGNFNSFSNVLQYNFRFAKRWSIDANYRFSYYAFSFPRKEQMVYQMVVAGINFHF